MATFEPVDFTDSTELILSTVKKEEPNFQITIYNLDEQFNDTGKPVQCYITKKIKDKNGKTTFMWIPLTYFLNGMSNNYFVKLIPKYELSFSENLRVGEMEKESLDLYKHISDFGGYFSIDDKQDSLGSFDTTEQLYIFYKELLLSNTSNKSVSFFDYTSHLFTSLYPPIIKSTDLYDPGAFYYISNYKSLINKLEMDQTIKITNSTVNDLYMKELIEKNGIFNDNNDDNNESIEITL